MGMAARASLDRMGGERRGRNGWKPTGPGPLFFSNVGKCFFTGLGKRF